MTKPTHYLLVGLPYSGKTTLAQELVKLGNFAHINIDQLKWDRGYTRVGDDDVPDQVWNEIFATADQLLITHLQLGVNVANEYAWITRAWRDRARQVATSVGIETKVIYLQLPRATILERWQANSIARNRFHWPEKEMQDIFHDFEEPTDKENVIIYNQTIPLEAWIRNNIQGPTL